jgi:hypothetical protein
MATVYLSKKFDKTTPNKIERIQFSKTSKRRLKINFISLG